MTRSSSLGGTALLAVLVSAISATTVTFVLGRPTEAAGPPAAEGLSERVDALDGRLEALTERIGGLEADRLVVERSPTAAIDEAVLRQAVLDWLRENGREAMAAARGDASADDASAGELTVHGLLAELAAEGLSDEDRTGIWRRAKEAGLLDEMIEVFEERAAASPADPDAQSDLGAAYLSAIEHLDSQTEQGDFATKADASFDAALALDDHHWEARFLKALSLSFWPAFLGRGPESVGHFEVLMEQQEQQAKQPHFASTYLYLGNMHAQAGRTDRANEIWQRGLREFPDNGELRTRAGQ